MKKATFKTKLALFSLIAVLTIPLINTNAQVPANVTNAQDRDQMLTQLSITLPSLPAKLADTNAPADAYPSSTSDPEGNWRDAENHTITRSGFGLWNNYDDYSSGFFPGPDSLRVGNYSPINLLEMNGGGVITTPEEWWEDRRPEVLYDVQHEVWGVVPDDSILPNVTWSVQTSYGGSGSSAYIQKNITGYIDSSRYPAVRNFPRISAQLRIPANGADSVPVMVVFGGSLDTYYGYVSPYGWGACTFDPLVLQPDNGAGLTSYLIGLCNRGDWRKPEDWGALAAWGWGVSKLIDYFETDSMIDCKKIGITGHSRYGKAALVTMAYDERIFIGFPSDGGSLGTKMNRRHWGQDLESGSWDQEYQWTAGNVLKWMGPLNTGGYMPRKLEDCPVDAHSLMSLCAPRPVFVNGGNTSSWCDPYGEYLTTEAVTPVYKLLGDSGVIMNDPKPILDKAYIEGNVAYRYHNEGHTDVPDWPSFMEFATKYVKIPKFSLSKDAMMLPDTANSTDSLFITSDTTWDVTCSESWVTLNIASGVHNDTVTVIAEANTEDTARSATIVFSIPGYDDRIVMVNQATADPNLSLSTDSVDIDDLSGSTATFDVISNTAWNVSTSQSWLSANPTGSINNKTVTLSASANTDVTERTAYAIVSAFELLPDTVVVTQEGADPTLVLIGTNFQPISSLSISGAGGSGSFYAITNSTSATFEKTQSWLSISTTYNSQWKFYTVNLTAEANPETTSRQDVVTVTVQGLAPQTVTVTQSAGGTSTINEVNTFPGLVFPNPFKDEFFIHGTETIQRLSVFDVKGNRILEEEVNAAYYVVNTTGFDRGMYILQISTPKQVYVTKLIKE